ncbi:MAG: DUF2279 domain-containing protein [Lewinellaceae bacterium]|nr:DUF2279 domain-containing protein [Lewinellaceae bacterium]
MFLRFCLQVLLLCIFTSPGFAQKLFSLTPSDSLHKGRLRVGIVAGSVLYSASMVGLYKAWYTDYPVGKFHTFNDLREWNQMDKMGHWLMSYNESRWGFGIAKWTGMRPRKAAWAGFVGGQLIQTSLEIFDGFSEQWGWSWSDVGFNALGSGLFLAQELSWHEQRISMKMSAMPVRYPNEPIFPVHPQGSEITTSLQKRADELYGTGPVNLFLKNYNTLVVWASVNPRSFLGERATWCPRWLNLALGMGADNVFEGFGYQWQQDKSCIGNDCLTYRLDPQRFPRTRQFFLSPDVDLTRIPVKGRFWKALLYTANIFKFPAPALEWNNRGDVRWHWGYF